MNNWCVYSNINVVNVSFGGLLFTDDEGPFLHVSFVFCLGLHLLQRNHMEFDALAAS